jgi:hypothetical protein
MSNNSSAASATALLGTLAIFNFTLNLEFGVNLTGNEVHLLSNTSNSVITSERKFGLSESILEKNLSWTDISALNYPNIDPKWVRRIE